MTPANVNQQTTPPWLRPAAWIIAALTTAIILYWGLNRAPQNAFDDAYITYRYADNFRQGLGLRYNPGEWVFGTTTPLYTLLLGGLGLVVSDLELLGHWLGVIGWISAALLTIPLFQHEKRPYAALIAPLLIALQPTFYTSLGMETPLLVALMLAVALFWLRGSNKIAVILAASLILTRHDSALWLLLIGLEVGRRRYNKGESWPDAIPWREGLVTLLLTLPWFLFAWIRYGSPLPNSAAAKIGQNNLMPVEGQSPFALALLESFINRLPSITVIFLLFLFILAAFLIIRRQHRFWYLLLWPILYALFYTIINVANFPWYFVPPITLLLILLALALGSLLGDEDWQLRPHTPILISPNIWRAIAIIGLAFFLINQTVITLDRQDSAGYRPSYLSAAQWLRQNTPPDATVATIEIGVIGYHSRRPIIDTQGLISQDMTNHQLGWDDTLVYALNAHQPDYALALPGTAWDIVTAQWWFKQSYEPVGQFDEATLYGRTAPLQSPNTIDVSIAYQGGFFLDDLTLASTQLEPGEYLTASLSISVTQPSPPPIRFSTYLVETGNFNRHAVTDFDPFENLYPSQHWQEGDYLHIPFRLLIPPDLPWGAYQLGLSIHNTAPQSIQIGELHLGLLTYGRPQATTNPNLTPVSINQSWANGIILEQLSLPEMPISPGTEFPLQIQWRTTAQPARNWTYFIHLVDDKDEIVAQLDQRPWNGRWPTTAWAPGESILEDIVLTLPADLSAGSYSLRLGFYIADQRLFLANETADFLWLPNAITVEP